MPKPKRSTAYLSKRSSLRIAPHGSYRVCRPQALPGLIASLPPSSWLVSLRNVRAEAGRPHSATVKALVLTAALRDRLPQASKNGSRSPTSSDLPQITCLPKPSPLLTDLP
eukprot:5086374-Heterocapsa_arctica.AAC.1